jgi:hypothetical protein
MNVTTRAVTFTESRWLALRGVATGDRQVGLTKATDRGLQDLVNAYQVEWRGAGYVLTEDGGRLYREWAREQALTDLPGVTVRHARREWRCFRADEFTSYDVMVGTVESGHWEKYTLQGPGAADYIRELRAGDRPVTTTGFLNPDYDPNCLATIRVGDAFAVHAARPDRKHCIRCALAHPPEQGVRS